MKTNKTQIHTNENEKKWTQMKQMKTIENKENNRYDTQNKWKQIETHENKCKQME